MISAMSIFSQCQANDFLLLLLFFLLCNIMVLAASANAMSYFVDFVRVHF